MAREDSKHRGWLSGMVPLPERGGEGRDAGLFHEGDEIFPGLGIPGPAAGDDDGTGGLKEHFYDSPALIKIYRTGSDDRMGPFDRRRTNLVVEHIHGQFQINRSRPPADGRTIGQVDEF